MVKLPLSIIVLQMRDEREEEERRGQGGSEEERSQPRGRTILMSLPFYLFIFTFSVDKEPKFLSSLA